MIRKRGGDAPVDQTPEERPIEALRRRQQAVKAEARKSLESDARREPVKLSTAALEQEVRRSKEIKQRTSMARGVIVSLLCAVAVAVVLTIYFFPALALHGQSMEPTFEAGDLVLSSKVSDLKRGDLLAFSYDNEIMVKRIVAIGGDIVGMDENGVVSVNGEALDEPYVKSLTLGQCDIEFPFRVPDGKYFVLGDNREMSVDSRSKEIGTVAESQVVGRLVFRLWPLGSFGFVS